MTNTSIIANGIVLTCDATNRCGPYHLLVANGRILDISESFDKLVRDNPDAEIIDASDKLLLPGFINAHYHTESFLLHALTDGTHYTLWNENTTLKQTSERLMHTSSAKDLDVLYGTVYAAHARCGTTWVGEFPPCVHEESLVQIARAIETSRLGCVLALRTWDHIRGARALGSRGLRVAVSLGEERDMTVYSIENALRAAKDLKASILAHVAEQREDADTMLRNFQKGIITLLQSFNALRPETIIVHANHITETEAAMVKDANGTVVVCPRSTAAKQTGYPALRHLAKRFVRLALGTDWGSIDMVEEMRFVSQLPLVVPGLRAFSPLEIVRMATINGAAALNIHKDTGSLEVGKRADIVFFSLNSLRVAQLSKHSRAEEVARCVVDILTTGDISDVMVAGEFVLRDRTLARTSEPERIAEWRGLCSRYLPGQPALQTPVQPAAQPANIIPFTQEPREPQAAEGFESGFPPSPSPPVATTPEVPPHPFANRPKVQREPAKIELPKNTRTVFGEDEDI